MKQINLRLSEDAIALIDEARGDVPRNTWILRAVELRLMTDRGIALTASTPKSAPGRDALT